MWASSDVLLSVTPKPSSIRNFLGVLCLVEMLTNLMSWIGGTGDETSVVVHEVN